MLLNLQASVYGGAGGVQQPQTGYGLQQAPSVQQPQGYGSAMPSQYGHVGSVPGYGGMPPSQQYSGQASGCFFNNKIIQMMFYILHRIKTF